MVVGVNGYNYCTNLDLFCIGEAGSYLEEVGLRNERVT